MNSQLMWGYTPPECPNYEPEMVICADCGEEVELEDTEDMLNGDFLCKKCFKKWWEGL